ncbi:GvpL/GvpF family gas vesicle protein [Streptomyces sp. SYSU K21746]
MTLYVYSIISAEHPQRLDDLEGVGDPPSVVRVVTNGAVCAVVSDAPEELRPKRRDLSAHQAVQERLLADGSVLPFRFGMTAPDDDAVRAALDDRTEQYAERLSELEGCAEYRLNAAQDEDALLRQILAESDEARRLNDEIRSGRGTPDLKFALGELVAREVQLRQDALAVEVLGILRPFARDERLSEASGNDFLKVSFLVDRDNEEGFTAAHKSLVGELGEDFDFRLHGPLPAYSFV